MLPSSHYQLLSCYQLSHLADFWSYSTFKKLSCSSTIHKQSLLQRCTKSLDLVKNYTNLYDLIDQIFSKLSCRFDFHNYHFVIFHNFFHFVFICFMNNMRQVLFSTHNGIKISSVMFSNFFPFLLSQTLKGKVSKIGKKINI